MKTTKNFQYKWLSIITQVSHWQTI